LRWKPWETAGAGAEDDDEKVKIVKDEVLLMTAEEKCCADLLW
jgi:hypothetical protein